MQNGLCVLDEFPRTYPLGLMQWPGSFHRGIAAISLSRTRASAFSSKAVAPCCNGKGTLLWPNGDSYEGDFLNGNLTGRGVMTGAGIRREGEFLNGVLTSKSR